MCVSIPTTTFVKYINKGKFTQLRKKKIYALGQNFWCERGSQMKWITRNLNPVADFYCRFKQLGLERELIKVQANLDAEMNMRNQANTAKADLESE